MSRGSNRNKVDRVKKSKNGTGQVSSSFFPALIGLLVLMTAALVATIISNAKLQGALTMLHAKEMEHVATRPMGTTPNKKSRPSQPHSQSSRSTSTHNHQSNQSHQNHQTHIIQKQANHVMPVMASTASNSGVTGTHTYTPSHVKTIFFPPGLSKAEMERQLEIETEKALNEVASNSNNNNNQASPAQAPTNGSSLPGSGSGSGSGPGKNNNNNNNDGFAPRRSNRLSYYYFDSHTQSFHLKDARTFYHEKKLTVENRNTNASPTSVQSFQSALPLSGKYQPTLCSDGETYGFNDLITLSSAVRELGDAYENAVDNYKHYRRTLNEYENIIHKKGLNYGDQISFDGSAINIQPPPTFPKYMRDLLNIVPDPFVICPNAYLRGSSLNSARNMIYINAEDVVVECDSCVIDSPGTHMSYGPLAKNSVIRGITFRGATDTSLIFRHDGAEVAFEDCTWLQNDGVGPHGSVVDMNSTSVASFHRCEIGDNQRNDSPLPRTINGDKSPPHHSLTIRSKGIPTQ